MNQLLLHDVTALPTKGRVIQEESEDGVKLFIRQLMAHNWQNWKRVFISCYCPDIYRVEAVGVKNYSHLKTYHFCEYVKFGAISLKIDILPITS